MSRASTSLTTRSAVQIRTDRAFTEGISEHAADIAKPEVIVQTLVDTKPLGTVEGAKRGIGRDVTRAWFGKLREIAPQANLGDPVASNALSRDGVPVQQPPGMFAQIPERLGQWREDMSRIDPLSGSETKGPKIGQWVPQALVDRMEREAVHREEKLARAKEKRDREAREFEARAKVIMQREAEAAREAARIEAEEQAKAEAEAKRRAAIAAKRADLEKKRAMAPSCLGRPSSSASSSAAAADKPAAGGAGQKGASAAKKSA